MKQLSIVFIKNVPSFLFIDIRIFLLYLSTNQFCKHHKISKNHRFHDVYFSYTTILIWNSYMIWRKNL